MDLTATEIGIVAAIGVVFFGLVGFDWWRHRGRPEKTGPHAPVDGPDAGVVWLVTTAHQAGHIASLGHDSGTSTDGGASSGGDGT